jgi:hypothetical protein
MQKERATATSLTVSNSLVRARRMPLFISVRIVIFCREPHGLTRLGGGRAVAGEPILQNFVAFVVEKTLDCRLRGNDILKSASICVHLRIRIGSVSFLAYLALYCSPPSSVLSTSRNASPTGPSFLPSSPLRLAVGGDDSAGAGGVTFDEDESAEGWDVGEVFCQDRSVGLDNHFTHLQLFQHLRILFDQLQS